MANKDEKVVNTAEEFEAAHKLEIRQNEVSYFKKDTFKEFLNIDCFDTTRLGSISKEILKHENVQNIINHQVQRLEIDLEKAEKQLKRTESQIRMDFVANRSDLKVKEQDAMIPGDKLVIAAQDVIYLIRADIVRNRTSSIRLTDRISYLYNVRDDLKVNREPAAPIGYERLETLISSVLDRRAHPSTGRKARTNVEDN